MRISDWSSDVCSSDLIVDFRPFVTFQLLPGLPAKSIAGQLFFIVLRLPPIADRWRWYLIYHAQNRKTTAWHDAVGWGCGRHVNTGRTPEWISRSISNSLFRSCRSDRKSVVEGKSVSVRLDLGGRRILNKKKKPKQS